LTRAPCGLAHRKRRRHAAPKASPQFLIVNYKTNLLAPSAIAATDFNQDNMALGDGGQ
jgi:hypothetical protein